MKIYFRNKALQKICSIEEVGIKKLGSKMAKKLRQRMMELEAADALADMSTLPPARCHELGQQRKGQLSVDLKHPKRLLFVPADDPIPRKDDGGLDKDNIKEIEIIEITDPHPRRKR